MKKINFFQARENQRFSVSQKFEEFFRTYKAFHALYTIKNNSKIINNDNENITNKKAILKNTKNNKQFNKNNNQKNLKQKNNEIKNNAVLAIKQLSKQFIALFVSLLLIASFAFADGYSGASPKPAAHGTLYVDTITSKTDASPVRIADNEGFEVTTGPVLLASVAGNVGIGTTGPNTYYNTNAVWQIGGINSDDKWLTVQGANTIPSVLNLENTLNTDGGTIGGILWTRTGGQGDAHRNIAGVVGVQRGIGTTAGSELQFWTKAGSGPSAKMTITNTGNVGIGTIGPSYKLHVAGDIYANGGWLRVSGNQGLYFQSWGGGFYMSDATWIRTYNNKNFYHNTGIMRTDGEFDVGPGGNRFIVQTGGNVGIGTTGPQEKLTVGGGGTLAVINAAAWDHMRMFHGGATAFLDAGGAESGLALRVDGSAVGYPAASYAEVMRLMPSGNVGIGTTSPGSRLEVENTASADDVLLLEDSSGLCEAQPATTGLTWLCSSDIRLKANVRNASDVLGYIAGIPLKDYTVIKTSENATGPIAQDLLETNPELVRQGDDGYYQVSELSQWTLVKAIQELKAENNELKKRIEALE